MTLPRPPRPTLATTPPTHSIPPPPLPLALTCFTLSLSGVRLGAPCHKSADGEEAAAALTSTDQDSPVILIGGLRRVLLLQLCLGEGTWGSGQGEG